MVYNILLVDDTWFNLVALKNIIGKINILNTRIVIETCNDGDKAV